MNMTTTFDDRSVRQFGNMVGRVQQEMRRDLPRTVRFLAGTLGRSLIAMTPPSSGMTTRKRRYIVPAPAGTPVMHEAQRRSSKAPRQAKWAVQVLHQGGLPPSYLGYLTEAGAKASKGAIIRNRGLADLVWKIAIARAGGGTQRIDAQAGANIAGKYADGHYREGAATAEAMLANRLPYIQTLDSGGPHNPPFRIMLRAFPAAVKRLEWLLAQHARKAKRSWG